MKRIELICMRLEDMVKVHPDQVVLRCARCDADVGVYPSGQSVLLDHPGEVDVVCQVCKTPNIPQKLAPGAELEPFQSIPAKGKG